MVSGGEYGAEDEIVVTAPKPRWNNDLNTYSVMLNDGGYVTYDRICTSFFGLGGCYFAVSGGGTYQINGSEWQVGTSGVDRSGGNYTYTPTPN
jgi:hypothetical protein